MVGGGGGGCEDDLLGCKKGLLDESSIKSVFELEPGW